MTAIAQIELEQASERTKAVVGAKHARGEHWGRPPKGFRLKSGRVEVEAEYAAAARRVVELDGTDITVRAMYQRVSAEAVFEGPESAFRRFVNAVRRYFPKGVTA